MSTGQLSVREGLVRQLDYWWTVFRRTWRGGFITSFVAPLFYVVAMGVLLGGFIQADPDRLEGATSYLAFVVPGLVAAHAMQVAVGETTYPVMGGIKWGKTYWAQLATPLQVRDIVNAHLAFAVAGWPWPARSSCWCSPRSGSSPPGGVRSLAWAGQVLVGTAFACAVMAFSVRLRSDQGVRRALPARGGAALPVLRGVLPDRQPGRGRWSGWPGPPRCGTASTSPGCSAWTRSDWLLALVHLVYLAAVSVVGWWLAVAGLDQRLEV